MANIFDYLAWRGDLDFNISPFNPVDNIIFSQLSYLTLDDIVPCIDDNNGISIDLAIRQYNEKLHSPEGIQLTSFFKDDPKLINALALSRRFGKCFLFGYVNHIDTNREIQFAALSIHINAAKDSIIKENNNYIIYRGTDSSIIGWKENFNMSFKNEIPAQIEAVEYLERMASKINGPLHICGHSKGGNLAIYAAANCSKKVQNRIVEIFSNDAPGFNKNIISSSGFKAIKDRIRSFVPQESVIGMILEHGYENKIIKSSQNGLMQHDLYSWEVAYNDLVYADKMAISSKYISNTLREWMDNLDNSGKEQFIDAMYHVLNSADVKSVYELEVSWFPSACRIIKSLGNIDVPTQKLIRKIIAELLRSAGKHIDTLLINNEELGINNLGKK
ncbi:MAG: DUF2974 domain-containing protein [Treponema sp.]|nr:DUF2974 domain-containing protein [Treponema sp.]MCL2251900.1 DUF2974 domain-containing protein [Treponema sp.]